MKTVLLLGLMTISAESLASRNELPFHEPVKLAKITMKSTLKTNLLSSYRELNLEGKKKFDRKIALRN